jgi:hypothetical protein
VKNQSGRDSGAGTEKRKPEEEVPEGTSLDRLAQFTKRILSVRKKDVKDGPRKNRRIIARI